MRWKRSTLTLFPVLAVLAAGCGDRDALGEGTLARAGNLTFEVETAARLVAPISELPSDVQVMEALSDFWMDYTLLALAVNEPGTLETLDLSLITDMQLNQELVMMLRDEVIDADTVISEEELRDRFEAARPGEQVRASHILLLYPEGATEAQQDSVRQLAEELRDRARAGEDFAAMAEAYSDDPGSAARGGDLDYFPRGTMVPPFEEAAFALQPGEVSEVVESQFGLHVIKSTDRTTPTFADMAEEFREQMVMERTSVAESIFVAGIEEPANVQITTDALRLARELAGDRDALFSPAQERTLVSYADGEYTTEDFRRFLMTQDPRLADQVSEAQDTQLSSMLRNLTRGELLVAEARRRGLAIDAEAEEALKEELREDYRVSAARLGLDGIVPEGRETLEQAVSREVGELMERLVRSEVDVFPLGPLSLPLRAHYGARTSREQHLKGAERMAQLRADGFTGDQRAPAPAEELDELLPGGDPDPELPDQGEGSGNDPGS
jgi:hypothetical protein